MVVKALGGEEVKLPKGMEIRTARLRNLTTCTSPLIKTLRTSSSRRDDRVRSSQDRNRVQFAPSRFRIKSVAEQNTAIRDEKTARFCTREARQRFHRIPALSWFAPHVSSPAGCTQVVPGSSWGTFTIAATIPMRFWSGLWMYRIRPGRVVGHRSIGGMLTLAAVVAGNWIPGLAARARSSPSRADETILALGIYGFIAAVLAGVAVARPARLPR